MVNKSLLSYALKEWNVAVEALETGKTALLMRKGGIREQGGHFTVDYHKVLLYPTFEHQKPELLKPQYRPGVKPVATGWHPESIKISSWAEITHIISLNKSQVEAAANNLLDMVIWNQEFLSDRLNWKPHKPLHLLLLKTHKLPHIWEIPYQQTYGGCRSWIELNTAIPLDQSLPVLKPEEYQAIVNQVLDFSK